MNCASSKTVRLILGAVINVVSAISILGAGDAVEAQQSSGYANPNAAYSEASKAYSKKDFKGVIAITSEALKKSPAGERALSPAFSLRDPLYGPIYYIRGKAYHVLKMYDEAYSSLDKALCGSGSINDHRWSVDDCYSLTQSADAWFTSGWAMLLQQIDKTGYCNSYCKNLVCEKWEEAQKQGSDLVKPCVRKSFKQTGYYSNMGTQEWAWHPDSGVRDE